VRQLEQRRLERLQPGSVWVWRRGQPEARPWAQASAEVWWVGLLGAGVLRAELEGLKVLRVLGPEVLGLGVQESGGGEQVRVWGERVKGAALRSSVLPLAWSELPEEPVRSADGLPRAVPSPA
jgi:hypothetical protein